MSFENSNNIKVHAPQINLSIHHDNPSQILTTLLVELDWLIVKVFWKTKHIIRKTCPILADKICHGDL